MPIKTNQSIRRIKSKFINPLILSLIVIVEISAQTGTTPPPAPGEALAWMYIGLAVLAIGSAGAAYWWFGSKNAQADNHFKPVGNTNNVNRNPLDGNKETEWLRKNQQSGGTKNNQTAPAKINRPVQPSNSTANMNQTAGQAVVKSDEAHQENSFASENESFSLTALPIFSFNRLELAKPFDSLPVSNDEDLMSAIEQSYDEFEEDEEVRELALRVLTAFKKRNSVEAVSQIALYDLSSGLRSKAVNVLSEFDHESVFETILLANADPTREVRAAAARSLTKLTFDRADAWTRIAESGEEGRITQSARAAMESGFVDMSFVRLVSKDRKQAYEAFALMALLIKAGETAKIFKHLETSREMNVRRAILHTIKVTKDQKALEELYSLLEKNTLPVELQEEVEQITEEIGLVAA